MKIYKSLFIVLNIETSLIVGWQLCRNFKLESLNNDEGGMTLGFCARVGGKQIFWGWGDTSAGEKIYYQIF